MNDVIRDLLNKRLLFVTGKGGVGKTSVALALGMRAVEQGKRVIVCEVASQERTSRIFNRTEVGFNEVEMAEGLWTISIDPDDSMREYVLLQLKVRAMRDLLFKSRIFTYLAAATPGLKELVTIGKIWELAQPSRKVADARSYDLVIVDAPATGHGVGFLQTPRTFAGIARVGPIHSQAQRLDAMVTDHENTGVVIVSLPEEMPVNESATLERDLREEIGITVDRVYMNGVYPERFSADELELLRAAAPNGRTGNGETAATGATTDTAPAPAPAGAAVEPNGSPARAAIRAALSEAARAASQREQLERLRELCDTDVHVLPFLFQPQLGIGELDELAEELA